MNKVVNYNREKNEFSPYEYQKKFFRENIKAFFRVSIKNNFFAPKVYEPKCFFFPQERNTLTSPSFYYSGMKQYTGIIHCEYTSTIILIHLRFFMEKILMKIFEYKDFFEKNKRNPRKKNEKELALWCRYMRKRNFPEVEKTLIDINPHFFDIKSHI